MKRYFLIFTFAGLLFPQQVNSLSDLAYKITNTVKEEKPKQENTDHQLKQELTKVKHQLDSVKSALLTAKTQPNKILNEVIYNEWKEWQKSYKKNYENGLSYAFWIMFIWLFIMAGLLLYGIYFYNTTAGLGRKRYNEIILLVNGDDKIPIAGKVASYPQNPFLADTLGLPPGTVRGALTFTLMLASLLATSVLSYAPPFLSMNDNFEYITTAFLMMIAFYFGSKAVDVFREREKTRQARIMQEKEQIFIPQNTEPVVIEENEEEKPATTPIRDPLTEVQPVEKTDGVIRIKTVREKCLSLTCWYETGKKFETAVGSVTGNFDGMGLSFGCLQWNFGQGSLQPLLKLYFESTDDWRQDNLLRQLNSVLALPVKSQTDWAKSIQEVRGKKYIIAPEWIDCFRILGEKTKQIQLAVCNKRFDIAENWCNDLALTSERALALMFDISVQNGSLYKTIPSRNIDVKKSINTRIINAGNPGEEDKMIIIAEERSKASAPQWQKVVLDRKLTIARGRGLVYGSKVNLDDFGISLQRPFCQS